MQNDGARPYIVIIGAADTGRAPMAAAMLQRHMQRRYVDALIESAGILGHDGDPATEAAQRSIEQMGLDIQEHVARSLTDELAASASLLIGMDSGVTRVARSRFPSAAERIYSLGELANQERDIPDPFKMQIGAWLSYATEIDKLLERAMPHILMRIGASQESSAPVVAEQPPSSSASAPQAAPAPTLKRISVSAPAPESKPAETVTAPAQRMLQVLDLIIQMPHVISWEAARLQIAADLDALMRSKPPADLAYGLAGLLRAALSMTPETPNAAQASALREAIIALAGPVQAAALSQMSVKLAAWGNFE